MGKIKTAAKVKIVALQNSGLSRNDMVDIMSDAGAIAGFYSTKVAVVERVRGRIDVHLHGDDAAIIMAGTVDDLTDLADSIAGEVAND